MIKTARKIHRFLAWVVGLQVVLWFLSGLTMSVLDIHQVRGKQVLKKERKTLSPLSEFSLPPQKLTLPQNITKVEYLFLPGPTYRITYGENNTHLYHAQTGEKLSPLKLSHVKSLVSTRLQPTVQIQNFKLLHTPEHSFWDKTQYRGPYPVWRLKLNDSLRTYLFISPQSGKILSVRNRLWRLFDFVWMFHILDFDTRSNFNHPLLVFLASLSLFFALSGVILLVRKKK